MKQVEGLLAIDGGTPVRADPLPYARQLIDDADVQAVVDVLRSEWLTTGPRVEEFEAALAEFTGARYAVAYSSGTAALHGAVFAAGLGPGDEAVTTPLTFCATANCVLYQGATPVFADVSPDTGNLDPEQVKARIGKRTRAVLPIDYGGHPADLDPLLELAADRGMLIIEDACHALGAESRGRKIGGLSHLSVFSFHPAKHITTGEGGAVTTNDPALAKRLRVFRSHGIDSDARQRKAEKRWHYEMTELGYNYRLTDIGAVLGLSQLKRIAENVARRRDIARMYEAGFANVPQLGVPCVRADMNPAWHLYPIRLRLDELRAGRDQIIQALWREGIGVNVHYVPVHFHPYYRSRFGLGPGSFPIAEGIYETLVSLPMFHGMSDADVADVVAAVSKVLGSYAR